MNNDWLAYEGSGSSRCLRHSSTGQRSLTSSEYQHKIDIINEDLNKVKNEINRVSKLRNNLIQYKSSSKTGTGSIRNFSNNTTMIPTYDFGLCSKEELETSNVVAPSKFIINSNGTPLSPNMTTDNAIELMGYLLGHLNEYSKRLNDFKSRLVKLKGISEVSETRKENENNKPSVSGYLKYMKNGFRRR